MPSNLTPHRFKAKWKNITLTVVKYVIVVYVVVGYMISAIQGGIYKSAPKNNPPLYGLYHVETFIKNRDTLSPLKTDTARWDKFMISYTDGAQIKLVNDSMKFYSFKTNIKKHSIVASTYADTLHKFNLTYELLRPAPVSLRNAKAPHAATDTATFLVLKGMWNNDSVEIRMRKMDPNNFRLLSRGFHFINEVPFNR